MTIRIAVIADGANEYHVLITDRHNKELTSMTFSGYNRGNAMVTALKLMRVTTIAPVGINAVEIMDDLKLHGFTNFI